MKKVRIIFYNNEFGIIEYDRYVMGERCHYFYKNVGEKEEKILVCSVDGTLLHFLD